MIAVSHVVCHREKVDLTPYVMRHEFRVDRAFDERAPNYDVYRQVVSPLVESCCIKEASCSFFAYGQTGSGKTYTMLGPQSSTPQAGEDRKEQTLNPNLIPEDRHQLALASIQCP